MASPDQNQPAPFSVPSADAGFERIVRDYFGVAYAAAHRVTGQDAMAKDVVQHTFIRLARQGPLLPARISIATWLRRTARSFAIDLVRAESSRRRAEEGSSDAVLSAAPEPAWERIAILLDRAVNELPGQDCELVRLKYFHRLTYAEIGRRLGISEQAARKRGNRSLEKLRTALGRQGIATTAAAIALLLPVHAATSSTQRLMGKGILSGIPSAKGSTGWWTALAGVNKGTLAAAVDALLVGAGCFALSFFPQVGLPAPELPLSGTPPAGSSPAASRAVIRSIAASNEEADLAAARGWMMERQPRKWKSAREHPAFRREIASTIDRLSAGSLELLLFDPAFSGREGADGESRYPLRADIGKMLCARYGELAPEAALAFAFPGGMPRQDTFWENVLTGVARVKPADAYALFKNFDSQMPDLWRSDIDRGLLLMDLAENWAKRSPADLLKAASSVRGVDRWALYSAYAAALPAQTDWTTESGRFEKLFKDRPDPDYSQSTAITLASRWGMADFDGAAAWLKTLPPDPAAGLSPYRLMVQSWILSEPDFAAGWLRTHRLPETDSDDFYADAFKYWAGDKPGLMAACLEGFHDPGQREILVQDTLTNDDNLVLEYLSKSRLLTPETRAKAAAELQSRLSP